MKKVTYYSQDSNYAILRCAIDDLLEGSLATDIDVGDIAFTGTFVDPRQGDTYTVYAEPVVHPKYGKQYNVIRIESNYDFSRKADRDRLVEMAFRDTPTTLANLYATYDDPFTYLVNNDVEALLKVKGIGMRTVHTVLNRFRRKYDYGSLYLELYEYNLTDAMCERFLDAYGSADLAIKAIRENPYALIYVVDGVGWKKADAIAMKGGGELQYSLHRVEAFIYYYLQLQGEGGNSWVDPAELMGALQENLGEDIPSYTVTEAIHDIDDKLWYNEEHTQIGLKKYYDIENKLATELLRIKDGTNSFVYDDWGERIRCQEIAQGWEFTDQQIEGIKACLENQVVLITGKGGTGKSSTVNGVLAVLGQYNHAMCALAGKAASRLAEVTGEEGFTIHRLLGYGTDDNGHFGFAYNEESQLPFDIVILDEVSMVNSELFWQLARAIPTGSKLIMLGDVAQLPPIGIGNTANDLLASPYITTVTLDKIHRQAAKSAIITESIAISNGQQIAEKDWVGTEVRGELQDLTLNCYHDASNTFYNIMEYYSRLVEQGKSIYDIQVVVPLRTRGDASVYNLNVAIQAIVNPPEQYEPELTISFMKDYSYTFRAGDKVINRKNNYKTVLWSEDDGAMPVTPIFNGNIGVIESVNTVDRSMIVNFTGIGRILIEGEALRNMQLAYAITCHSAQGSEFEYVIVGIDYTAYTMLSRQWLYTALTRAKQSCILCAQISALRYATYQNEVIDKHTHLQRCIAEKVVESQLPW